jgi:hypothetical protein
MFDLLSPGGRADGLRLSIQKDFVGVTPAPVLTRLKGLNDGMMRRTKMPSGVLVLGGVAASHVAAAQTEPEMNPRVAHLQAFFATRAAGMHLPNLVQVSAISFCHRAFSYNLICRFLLNRCSLRTLSKNRVS